MLWSALLESELSEDGYPKLPKALAQLACAPGYLSFGIPPLQTEEQVDLVTQELSALLASNLPLLKSFGERNMLPVKVHPRFHGLFTRAIVDYLAADCIVELKVSEGIDPSWVRQLAIYKDIAQRKGFRNVPRKEWKCALHLARYGSLIEVKVPQLSDARTDRIYRSLRTATQLSRLKDLCDEYDVLKASSAVSAVLAAQPLLAPVIAPRRFQIVVGKLFDLMVSIILRELYPISWEKKDEQKADQDK